MKKKLIFSTAILSAALLSHAGVLFTENWDFVAASEAELDPARWVVDDGCFGDGIYSPCFGDFSFGIWGDGTLNFSGANGDQGYWAGYALRSVPTFSASADKVLIVETKRISHTHTVQEGSATRTGLWLIAPDKSKWLLFADNYGESNWGFNPYSGTTADYPVNNPSNVGYDLGVLNGTFASNLRGELDLKVVANGSSASMYMRDPNAAEPVWVYGATVPLNFSENIAVALGVYTRAPQLGATLGDYVEGSFGPITVTEMDALYFAKDSLLLESGTTSDVIINVAASATPCTVTLTSSDSGIAIPEGAPGGVATINFAAGETEKTVGITSVGEGLAKFTLSAPESVWVNNSLAVTIPAAVGVKLEENFETLNPNVWEISTKGYEYAAYPAADVTVDFFGVRDGMLAADNMVATVNYWGGRSVISKDTFLGSTTTSLKVTADLAYMTHEAGVSTCANLVLRNADSSKFFALRLNRGEGGWQYNTAMGASGTKPSAWAALNDDQAHTMELVYNGTTMTMYVDGISGGTVNWVCNDPMFVELGIYAREAGAAGSGAFESVLVENIQNELPQGSVAPATVRAFPQFNNLLAVTVPEYATLGGDVELTLSSSDPSIATPEVATLTFLQDGEATQFVNILAHGAGTATISFASPNVEWLTVPNVTVNAYAEPSIMVADDFSGAAIDTALWQQVSRPAAGGTSRDLNFWIESKELLGYFVCEKGDHAVETQQIKDQFFPTADSPVVFEYIQGPLGGVGSVVVALGAVIDLNNNTACAFGYSRGDISGWNAYPGYSFTTDSRPSAYRQNRFLDNGYHKVRLVADGSTVRHYVDDVYGGSMPWVTDRITFALGGDAYKINNQVEFSFGDAKVYGTPTIAVTDKALNLINGTDTINFTVPSVAIAQGVTITLTVEDPSIATFDSGAVKTINIGPGSPADYVVTVSKVNAGKTFVTIENDLGILMTVDTLELLAPNAGATLFEDFFTGPDISPTHWSQDNGSWEGHADATGELIVTPGWGVILDYTLTVNYWGGTAFWTQKSYKASQIDPLSFVVDRNYFSYSEGSTGARCAILIRNGSGSRWIQIAESLDDSGYKGWVYNHYELKATGGGIQMPVLNELFADRGEHVVKLVADGDTVSIYVDDVLGEVLPFAVEEDIHFGFGLYTRAAGDSASTCFMSAIILGSGEPAPNPPVILVQPPSQFSGVGQPVSFGVHASGQELSYAWYKDGELLEGETSASITLPSASEADLGEYQVVVSNVSGFVRSESVYLSLVENQRFFDSFIGPELDAGLWEGSTRPFEYSLYPAATGTANLELDNALAIDFTLSENYWGGVAYYTIDTFNVSPENPAIFEIDRDSFGYNEGATGARCSFIVTTSDLEYWVNFSDSIDGSAGYIGWGSNRKIGQDGDNDGGRAVVFPSLNFAPLNDKGAHTVKVVADGQTATLYVDGYAGTPILFPFSEDIRFGIGVFTRQIPDNGWAIFRNASVWVDEGAPPVETPVLAFAVEDGKLILRWAVSSGAALEVSPQASGGLWTHAGLPEIKDGTWYYEVPLSADAAYYRLVAE